MGTRTQWLLTALSVALGEGSGLAWAQTTERVSVSSSGAQGTDDCSDPSLSADRRFVAFDSAASNFVAGDTNGTFDVFVRDRLNGTTERVSVATGGAQGNSMSGVPAISGDGRFVAFLSAATNLVAADTNGVVDVFVRDRLSGTTERVSVATGGAQGNGNCDGPVISGDGRFVAFISLATNLVTGDANGVPDIFVRDRLNGTTERVSVSTAGTEGNNFSDTPAISADGRFVAFVSSATNMVTGDTNGVADIFVRDRLNGMTERVSVDSSGTQGSDISSSPALSADGRIVAFVSAATNLVAGDTNLFEDIFVRDRLNGTTERASVATSGAQGNNASSNPSLSADGRFVGFHSSASSFVGLDTNSTLDVFVHDRLGATTERVSVDSNGTQANSASAACSLSADGRFVAFVSTASNLVAGDTNGFNDIFVRDRGALPAIPYCFGDGSAVACPCGNNGATGRGCANSGSAAGALLSATGDALLSGDTLVLSSSGELPTALSIFIQGKATMAAVNFGDGLRCAGGQLKRLYVRRASAGVVSAPQSGDPSISARSAARGDMLTAGTTRYYQTYYVDSNLNFCQNPPGNAWNGSSGLVVVWTQ